LPRGVFERTPEIRRKYSEAQRRLWADEDYRKGHLSSKAWIESREAVHLGNKRWWAENYDQIVAGIRARCRAGKWKRTISRALKGHPVSESTRAKIGDSLRRFYEEHPEARERFRSNLREWWSKPSFRRKMRKVFQRRYHDNKDVYDQTWQRATLASQRSGRNPNGQEKRLGALLDSLFPGRFKYSGCGEYGFIGGKIPDFLDSKHHLIVELFGNYLHSEKRRGRSKISQTLRRKAHFAKFGFDTLVVWESELKRKSRLTSKLKEFVGRRVNRCH
jgi:very-short-patch-repair endonuclease